MNAATAAQEIGPANIVPLPKIARRAAARVRQRFQVRDFVNASGSRSWRVSGIKRDGARVRENFSELAAAQCRQLELETEWLQGQTETLPRATTLTDEQLRLAEAACVQLGGDWPRLLDAVAHWKGSSASKAAVDAPTLDDAVEKFVEWLETPQCGMSKLSQRNLKIRLDIFRNGVRDLKLSEITPDFLEAFLNKRGVSPATRDNDRRAISRFFSWCIERPRRWISTNPAREVRIEKGAVGAPEILTVEQCEALLRAAENHKRGMLAPYVAVCLFGGLRPFEAMRLTWRQVNLEDNEIRLEAKQTKTGRARVVTIDRTLAKWLQAHRGKEFFPSGWRKNFDAVKLAAGIENWPVDVMRHTAISHFFRECESYGRTAEQFGNSEAIIKAHYQGRVKSAETARFYAILPKGKGNK